MNLAQADHPGKRQTERLWLWYTPVWGVACGLVMLTGLARRWGDAGLLCLGGTLGLGAFVLPLVRRAPEERGVPLAETAAFKLVVSVAGFAFLMNYTQTPFFFDVLHMHYGFQSTVNIRNNPVFLYLLTVAYFSTYAALALGALRWTRAKLARAPRWCRALVVATVPFAIAFLESALNANPFMKALFCYDDLGFTLTFGSLAYGLAFVCALPVWLAIDERRGDKLPLAHVLVAVCAAVYVDSLLLDGLRYLVAPRFTTVVEGAQGLRDFGHGCLVAP